MNLSSDMRGDAKFVGLTDNNELLMFSADASESASIVKANGLDGTLLGIDVRPADGKIYGLTTANKLYTLDPAAVGSGSFSSTAMLTEAEEAALLSNNLYVNLHTEQFAPGELRGQLNVEAENDVVQRGIVLEEAQQTNAVPDGPATGRFDVVYDDATNRLDVTGSFSDLTSALMPVGGMDSAGNPESAIHIHNAAAGANGPIVRNLTVEGNSFSGSFTLTDAEEAALLSDNLYVNLHSDNFAAGELRGQLNVDLEGDVVASGIAFEEAQQVNDVADGPATGAISITYDNSTNILITEGSYSNLSSALLPIGGMDGLGNAESPIHIHNGAAGANGPIIRNLAFQDDGATLVSTLDIPFEGGTISGFDFNPAADRLRLVGDNDQDFRINVETGAVIVDGTLAFAEGDANAGVNPNITAAAYTNSFAGTSSTQLYDIDTLLNQLVLQNPPNDGTLMTVGNLGVDFDTLGGFDILSDGMGGNAAFAVSNDTLYSVDLNSGAATAIRSLGINGMPNLQGFTVLNDRSDMSMDEMGMTSMAMDDGMDMEDMTSNSTVQPSKFFALTDGNLLLSFEADAPEFATKTPVTGLDGALLGIDIRPADGQIYGLTTANKIYTIATDGTATFVSILDTPFEGGTISGFDFNPAADRLRLVGDNDQDFRINVETGAVIVDGTLAYDAGDANAGVNPNITAAAYTNSFDGTTSTQLYDIDTLLNTLVLQSPPNDGVLMTVGKLGVDFDTLGGFDILSDGMGGNSAFAVSNGTLYSVDLSSGAATSLGMVGDDAQLNIQGLTVMAVLPDSGMNGEDNPDGMDVNGDMGEAQTLFGSGAADSLSGGAGDDLLYGNGGGDTLTGNGGNDQLFGSQASDRLTGGSGDDLLYGNGGEDIFTGDAGNDTLFGGSNKDIMMGGSGDDILYGNGGGDMLSGDGGSDKLYGSDADDQLMGGSGDDILYGNGGEDMLVGGSGNDLIYGGAQADVILGGAGNDVIYSNGGSDRIDSGIGMDEIWLGEASNAIITLNSGEGFTAIKNFQQGSTQLIFNGAVTYEDSSEGAQIFSGSDLLAVVAWNRTSQLQGSMMMG